MTYKHKHMLQKDIGGFRLNPYFNYSIALLGNNVDGTQQIKGILKSVLV
jgi:hypothetical protein